jgi:hypothetical protein
MADLSQTAANVAIGAQGTPTRTVQYGGTVTQGNPVYRSATDGKYYRTDANDGVAKAVVAGIALTPGTTDTYGLIALPSSVPGQSRVNLGATLAKGEIYAVSAAAGAICPIGDITTGQYVTALGVAVSTALLDFQPIISNETKA